MKVYFEQCIQLRRPCVTDTAVENNIGQSDPGSNGHQAIGGSAMSHSSCDRSHLGKYYDNGASFGQAYSKMRI